jgi:hypothetical protein
MVEITYMVPDFLVRDYEAPITDVNDPGIYNHKNVKLIYYMFVIIPATLRICYHSSHFKNKKNILTNLVRVILQLLGNKVVF